MYIYINIYIYRSVSTKRSRLAETLNIFYKNKHKQTNERTPTLRTWRTDQTKDDDDDDMYMSLYKTMTRSGGRRNVLNAIHEVPIPSPILDGDDGEVPIRGAPQPSTPPSSSEDDA